MSYTTEHVPQVDASRFSPELHEAKQLRDFCGAPLMQCMQALRACNGDWEIAIEILRLKRA